MLLCQFERGRILVTLFFVRSDYQGNQHLPRA